MITPFRDGFQSVYGGRVLTKDFLPAVEAAVGAGLTHMETGGGAMFQTPFFYCNENAFDRMDEIRRASGPGADLQTLARGINLVGLDSYSSDIIRLHAKLFKKHGVTTIRNFDALNNVENLDYTGRCIVAEGLKHEICVSLMGLPPGLTGSHTPEFYIKVLRDILDAAIPFNSVCFKDASGTTTPRTVHETIKRAKAMLPEGTPLRFHTHETAGTSIACYMAALDAGATAIDLSLDPMSGGTCQPDVVVMWHALRGTDYDLDIDIHKVLDAERVLKECMKDYFLLPEASRVEPAIPFSPMPGGAFTTNTQMMRDCNILDRFPEVMVAMEEVVARGGFGTSVTPVSQFYFQQAFNNVMFGPWKKIADGYGKMVLGYYGRTPVAPDPEVVRLASAQTGLQPAVKNPLQMNDENPAKGTGPARRMLEEAGLPVNDENIFIAAICLEKGISFLKGEGRNSVRKKNAGEKNGYTVTVDDKKYSVLVDGKTAYVNGKPYSVDIKEGADRDQIAQATRSGRANDAASRGCGAARPASAPGASSPAASEPAGSGGANGSSPSNGNGTIQVKSPLPGIILRINIGEGDTVSSGESLAILEVMKMETPIKAPADGVVSSIDVTAGEQVSTGQVILVLSV